MRVFAFGRPDPFGKIDDFKKWVIDAITSIEADSIEGPETVADGFTIENLTETRTLDCATATATDVANVLGTFLNDLKKRGANVGY